MVISATPRSSPDFSAGRHYSGRAMEREWALGRWRYLFSINVVGGTARWYPRVALGGRWGGRISSRNPRRSPRDSGSREVRWAAKIPTARVKSPATQDFGPVAPEGMDISSVHLANVGGTGDRDRIVSQFALPPRPIYQLLYSIAEGFWISYGSLAAGEALIKTSSGRRFGGQDGARGFTRTI
jgi:hypothetical protein